MVVIVVVYGLWVGYCCCVWPIVVVCDLLVGEVGYCGCVWAGGWVEWVIVVVC